MLGNDLLLVLFWRYTVASAPLHRPRQPQAVLGSSVNPLPPTLLLSLSEASPCGPRLLEGHCWWQTRCLGRAGMSEAHPPEQQTTSQNPTDSSNVYAGVTPQWKHIEPRKSLQPAAFSCELFPSSRKIRARYAIFARTFGLALDGDIGAAVLTTPSPSPPAFMERGRHLQKGPHHLQNGRCAHVRVVVNNVLFQVIWTCTFDVLRVWWIIALAVWAKHTGPFGKERGDAGLLIHLSCAHSNGQEMKRMYPALCRHEPMSQ